MAKLDIEKIRQDFPILQMQVYQKPLVYLDNAATTQKPQVVVDAMQKYYLEFCANVHRGAHKLSELATDAYENARMRSATLINAKSVQEIIFTKGTTDGINLVAQTFGRANLQSGDEVILAESEHHSNIVPWQMICGEKGAKIRVIPINDAGELDLEVFSSLISSKTKIVAVGHISNALGTIHPIKKIIEMAHAVGAFTVIDGAQAVCHTKVDVQDLDCDFYAFSGHKLCGPTGIGVLYGKYALLEKMPPYQGGGDMILSVSFEKTTYAKPPMKFEAGTPNITGALGLAAAIGYVTAIGFEAIETYEQELCIYGTKKLQEIPGLRLIGAAQNKAAILSFVMDGVHPHDISSIVDRQGIAIRAGHLCAQSVMKHYGIPALARASLSFYNTKQEIDALVDALYVVKKVFKC